MKRRSLPYRDAIAAKPSQYVDSHDIRHQTNRINTRTDKSGYSISDYSK